jgi:hypothetical protein
MGFLDIFKKKKVFDEQIVLDELKSFSMTAIELSTSEIEETNSFLPFGGFLTNTNNFEQIVYFDPSATTVDHRAHATIIQKLIMQKYKESRCKLIFIAFDGVAHLATGDINSINVRASHKQAGIHKLFTYPYTIENGRVGLIDIENPIIKNL